MTSRMTRYHREMKWSIIRRQYAPAILWGSAVRDQLHCDRL